MRLAIRTLGKALLVVGVVVLGLECSYAAEDFRIFTQIIKGAEENLITQYVLLTQGKRFSFLPPNGWSIKADKTKGILTTTPPDLQAGFTIRFLADPAGELSQLGHTALRERIQNRFPGVRFTHEFECAANGQAGLAFDLIRVAEKDTIADMRMAFVPYEGGFLEFELTTAAGKLADYHVRFSRMLNSFRIESIGGKVDRVRQTAATLEVPSGALAIVPRK